MPTTPKPKTDAQTLNELSNSSLVALQQKLEKELTALYNNVLTACRQAACEGRFTQSFPREKLVSCGLVNDSSTLRDLLLAKLEDNGFTVAATASQITVSW